VCSVLREECEDVIAEALRRAPWLAPVSLVGERLPLLPGAKALRLTPYEHGTDGFFLAALERR
jgi:16S rRNA C967 or C1407 C5-methylase (RsmB/RsmF family)